MLWSFTMSKWISGNELIEKKGLKDFEFFNNCVAKGLQPHNDLGKPIPPSELFNHAKSVGERVGVDLEIEQIDEGKTDWEGISLPKHDFNARTILSRLCHANYKRQEAEKFGLKPGSKPASVDNTHGQNHPVKEAVQKASKELPRDRHRRQTRSVAKKLWDKHPTMSVPEMIAHPDVLEAGKKTNGQYYADKTIKEWIKDLNPNPPLKERPRKKDD